MFSGGDCPTASLVARKEGHLTSADVVKPEAPVVAPSTPAISPDAVRTIDRKEGHLTNQTPSPTKGGTFRPSDSTVVELPNIIITLEGVEEAPVAPGKAFQGLDAAFERSLPFFKCTQY